MIFLRTAISTLAFISLLLEESSGQECLNARKNFKVQQQKYSCISVKQDRGLCYRHKKFKKKCPVLCGECDCKDVEGRFKSVVKGKMNCKKVSRKKNFHCKDNDARMYCPETCDMCAGRATVVPAPSPQVTCTVEGILSFPPISDVPYFGIHSDR